MWVLLIPRHWREGRRATSEKGEPQEGTGRVHLPSQSTGRGCSSPSVLDSPQRKGKVEVWSFEAFREDISLQQLTQHQQNEKPTLLTEHSQVEDHLQGKPTKDTRREINTTTGTLVAAHHATTVITPRSPIFQMISSRKNHLLIVQEVPPAAPTTIMMKKLQQEEHRAAGGAEEC